MTDVHRRFGAETILTAETDGGTIKRLAATAVTGTATYVIGSVNTREDQ